MKLRALITATAAGALFAGCGQNPLLKMATSDYAPFKVGAYWTYLDLSGTAKFTTRILSGSSGGSIGAFNIAYYSRISGTSLVMASGAAVNILSPIAQVDRKLPYITGNLWDLASPSLNVKIQRKVEGLEKVDTPAGVFENCFKLKTTIESYDTVANVTTTTGTFIWVAPNIGDVQYADINAAGTSVIDVKLGSYSLGQ